MTILELCLQHSSRSRSYSCRILPCQGHRRGHRPPLATLEGTPIWALRLYAVPSKPVSPGPVRGRPEEGADVLRLKLMLLPLNKRRVPTSHQPSEERCGVAEVASSLPLDCHEAAAAQSPQPTHVCPQQMCLHIKKDRERGGASRGSGTNHRRQRHQARQLW